MMKLFGSNPWRRFAIFSRVRNVAFFSTKAPQDESLYHIIWRSGDGKIPMASLLQQWLEQGRSLKQPDLFRIIKQLRKHRRFSQALQVSEWMSEGMNYELHCGDMAVRLDLISKVRGLAEAEEYFNSIPASSRSHKVEGALLNCYADKDSLAKAEELFGKLRESNSVKLLLPYNVMLGLYSRAGKHDKLVGLVQEMEENGVKSDVVTYSIRLNALAVTSEIEEMEKLLSEMEADPQLTVDFHVYFVAAKGYLKADLLEKALTVLKKAEQLMFCNGKKAHYEHIMTLYASAGKKDDVYRIWDRYKAMGKLYNTGYLAVISSLGKLGDFDGMEKMYKEWESQTTLFDNRIANFVISAYCKNGYSEKAIDSVNWLLNKGHELDSSVWQCLANQQCMKGEMEKTVEFMKKAVLGGDRPLRINRLTFSACLEYMKQEGDSEAALEILETLSKRDGSCSGEIYTGLVNYINGDGDDGALEAMKAYNHKEEKNLGAQDKE